MEKSSCFLLGKIAKSTGLRGEVSFFLDVDYPEEYSQLDMVFVDTGPTLVPFFIQSITIRDKGFARVKLEGVDSSDDSMPLVGKSLYVPLDILPTLSGNQFYYHEIIGFDVIDINFGKIGLVHDVIDRSPQPLLEIQHEDKFVLIPITDETILGLSRDEKSIKVHSPEGLIELYLN